MSRVLIMACSQAKVHQAGGSAPAYELYDGPGWRTFRKWLRSHVGELVNESTVVFALSAEHGVIDAWRHLEVYDRKMTPERVEELDNFANRQYLDDQLADLGDPANVFFFGGELYAQLLERLMPTDYIWYRAADRPNAGIGEQLGELKEWLYATDR